MRTKVPGAIPTLLKASVDSLHTASRWAKSANKLWAASLASRGGRNRGDVVIELLRRSHQRQVSVSPFLECDDRMK